jgi:hypothetical protein
MRFTDLYPSVFAILRIQNGSIAVAGTGFVVQTSPIKIMTCHHVVGEATEDNNGDVKYSISKRVDSFTEFDVQRADLTYMRASKILNFPQYDLAILEIDADAIAANAAFATSLRLSEVEPVEFDFRVESRELSCEVEWLSTAAAGDASLTPRFFKGCLVSRYSKNQNYSFKEGGGRVIANIITGGTFLEIDKLFIPGSSGSPILSSTTNRVIGFVHGFRAWQIETNVETENDAVITNNNAQESSKIKYRKTPMMTSLSLGIDVLTIRQVLIDQGIVAA